MIIVDMAILNPATVTCVITTNTYKATWTGSSGGGTNANVTIYYCATQSGTYTVVGTTTTTTYSNLQYTFTGVTGLSGGWYYAVVHTVGATGTDLGGPTLSSQVQYTGPTTVNFAYTGSATTWVAPPAVTSIDITLVGGGGGGAKYNGGFMGRNSGGLVSGTLAVTPNSSYQIYVAGGGGGGGQDNVGPVGAGGFGGGGDGGGLPYPGAGGGGASYIYGGATVLALAGGGGGVAGGSAANAGYGGGTTGGASGNPGGGGTQTTGGIAYYGGGTAGSFLQGGVGAGAPGPSGGGGGGGYYGGGAGYGGGGGSSYVALLTGTVVNTQGGGAAGGASGNYSTAGGPGDDGSVTIVYQIGNTMPTFTLTSLTTTAFAISWTGGAFVSTINFKVYSSSVAGMTGATLYYSTGALSQGDSGTYTISTTFAPGSWYSVAPTVVYTNTVSANASINTPGLYIAYPNTLPTFLNSFLSSGTSITQSWSGGHNVASISTIIYQSDYKLMTGILTQVSSANVYSAGDSGSKLVVTSGLVAGKYYSCSNVVTYNDTSTGNAGLTVPGLGYQTALVPTLPGPIIRSPVGRGLQDLYRHPGRGLARVSMTDWMDSLTV